MLAQRSDSKTKLKCLIFLCGCFNQLSRQGKGPKGGDLDFGWERGSFGEVFPLLIIDIAIT